jgi:hypothetical protein
MQMSLIADNNPKNWSPKPVQKKKDETGLDSSPSTKIANGNNFVIQIIPENPEKAVSGQV